MFKECRYILPTGYKCKSPALRDKPLCYFHDTSRRFAAIALTSADPVLFPSIEDKGGVQIALNQVFRGLGTRRIDARHAGLFFYGLQIAAGLAHKPGEKPSQTVREVSEESENGNTVAPEKTTCEPPVDCVDCGRRNFCEAFSLYRSKVRDLEERLRAEQRAREQNPALETCIPKLYDQ